MYMIPLNVAMWLNVIVIVLVLIALLHGYARGFIRQLLDLVILIIALLGAWFMAFRLAELVPLVPDRLEIFNHPIWGLLSHNVLNTAVWFVLLLIALTIGLAVLFKPIVRFVRDRHELRMIDRILGSAFSFLKTLVWLLLGMAVFLSPLVANGRAILERTLLTAMVPFADMLQVEGMKMMDPSHIFSEENKQAGLVDNATRITDWLIKNGIAEEFSVIIEKGLKNETFTQADVQKAQTFILENNISKETLVDFMKSIGIDQAQIDEALLYFKFTH